VTETTALGAAYLAGLALASGQPRGVRAKRQGDVRFEPKMEPAVRAERRGSAAGRGAGKELDGVKGLKGCAGNRWSAMSGTGASRGTLWWSVRSYRRGRGRGCGLAGLSVLLVEAHDFGKGTSSRSTKLVHGGVRISNRAIFRW